MPALHPIGIAIVAYLLGMIAIAWWARGRVDDVEEFVLAGRTLGLRVITSSLLATWIGAGTLLVAADEISRIGLAAIPLEPIGSGFALLFGALMAGRIRTYRVVTLPDLFRVMYGPRAEGLLAAIMIPADMVWTAVQYLALGSIIELYLGVRLELAIPVVASIGLLKTLIGGMHSIAMTDTVQVGVVVFCVGMVAMACLVHLGQGLPWVGAMALSSVGSERLTVVGSLDEAVPAFGLFLAASLGNAADPTVIQRVSAARTPRIATLACVAAGVGYLVIGLSPVVVGLTASLVVPNAHTAVMPALAGMLLSPWFASVVIVAMVATMLSTIDSNLMSPSTVLAHNIGARLLHLEETVLLHRITLLLVAALTVALTLSGLPAFRLLTLAYEVGMVATVVPVLLGLWLPADEETCLASIFAGGASWLYFTVAGQRFFGVEVPTAMGAMLLAAVVYVVFALRPGRSDQVGQRTIEASKPPG